MCRGVSGGGGGGGRGGGYPVVSLYVFAQGLCGENWDGVRCCRNRAW